MRGILVGPKPRSATAHAFSFMLHGISGERQVETAVKQTAGSMKQAREQAQRISSSPALLSFIPAASKISE